MLLDHITPYILTYNEEANIEKCLDALQWAKDVLVIDSFSDDRTLEIVAKFANTRVIQRAFDSHYLQHTFAIQQSSGSEWLLRLDADWIVTPELLSEIEDMEERSDVCGLRVSFLYSIYGEMTPISVYPPVIALFRRMGARYVQDGHTERLILSGNIVDARTKLIHEDKKSLDRYLLSQIKYSKLEIAKINSAATAKGFKTKLRKIPGLAPLLVAVYLLIFRGGLFRGRASRHYILQRLIAELTISLRLLDDKIRKDHTNTEIE